MPDQLKKAIELLRVALCPNCDGRGYFMVRTRERQFVSYDMAKDAGDPSLYGMSLNDEVWEQMPCEWCHEKNELINNT